MNYTWFYVTHVNILTSDIKVHSHEYTIIYLQNVLLPYTNVRQKIEFYDFS